jgi:hypothetical protein
MHTTFRPAALLLATSGLALIACSSADSGESADDPESASSALTATAGPIVSGIDEKCLDDSGDKTTNDNKIQLYSCNKTAAQEWTYTGSTFVGPGGKCLDIQSDNQVAGTIVQLYTCNGTDAQKWTLSGKAIKSTKGLCLDVKNGADANGTQIQIYGCNGNPSQQWTVSGVTSAPDAGAPKDAGKDAAADAGKDAAPDASKPSAAPILRQFNTAQTTGTSGFEADFPTQFKTPTEKGSTLWVVATIPNDGGQNNVSVEDTQGNTFKALDVEHDTGRGAQTVWHFYATNIKGDSGGTPDTVTVQWANDNYKGVLIAEVAGASEASLVGHSANVQTEDAPGGTNGVTSNDIETPASDRPALLLSLSMDTYGGYSDEDGDTYAGPIVGSGYTSEGVMWNFDPNQTCQGLPCNLATFESKTITSSQEVAGLFTARAPGPPSPTAGTYVTVAAVFH